MDPEIQIIPLKVPAYLISTSHGFILIDTGDASDCAALEAALDRAGVTPGRLDLIILTYGDFDHAGSAAFLQKNYAVPVAMHPADFGMVERADMSWNRKPQPDRLSLFFRFVMLISPLLGSGKFVPFTPDLAISEGFDLTPYGFAARVLDLPGHSKGSIGVLTAAGDLFCGDLLYNFFGNPTSEFVDDLPALTTSLAKIHALPIHTIYPGHGKPFPLT